MNDFCGNDMVTLKGIEKDSLDFLFDVSRKMEEIVNARTRADILHDKLLGLLFFQVSTRTRISFESAMKRLGGDVVGFVDPKTTRVGDYYQESLHDVIKVMENYADILLIRHPQDGAPEKAASFTDLPVINGGDGYNEHPTQSLLDAYTILREKGRLDDLHVAMVGDMNMRVMHGLPIIFGQYRTKVTFVSPANRTMPEAWLNEFDRVNLEWNEQNEIDSILDDIDVIYLMGTETPSYSKGKTEAGSDMTLTPKPYIIDQEKLIKGKKDIIVLHPLPRTDELPMEVDSTEAARYFVQTKYGVVLRMALLALMLGKEP
jgi:aspartate carbamoyltransferase catalytic subunit